MARVDSAKTEFMGAQGVGFEVVWRGADWRAATGIEAHGYCIAVVSVLSSYRLEGCRIVPATRRVRRRKWCNSNISLAVSKATRFTYRDENESVISGLLI